MLPLHRKSLQQPILSSHGSEDGPGLYTVTHDNAAVRAGLATNTPIVGRLRVGQAVTVLEVVGLPAEDRIRGRIASPAGWISLRETRIGYRWAKRASPMDEEKAQLVCNVLDRDRQLENLRARAARLRAEHEVHISNFEDRAQELEARLMASSFEPVESSKARAGHRSHDEHTHALHLEMDHMLNSPEILFHDPTVPPGGRVIDTKQIKLTPAMERAMVVLPQQPPAPAHKPQHDPQGNIITSNAVLMPSLHHAQPFPPGVYPITHPPVGALTEDLVDMTIPPLPTPDHYSRLHPGAWRCTDASGYPL
mmetsp:Transcript_84562/g.213254  ORF Transcript_84562/g.213254 Transcript_84562/m.213254 type:complete len:308 (+) Transcript_84562:60-983(+)